jgi:thiamine biosynthesis lipoprotein ApbE
MPVVLSRRSFLAATAVAPLWSALDRIGEYRLSYDHVIGTSLDAVVWTGRAETAQRAESAILAEVARLSAVLSTRDARSEISAFATSGRAASRSLRDVLEAYEQWERRTGGALSIRPGGPGSPLNVDALGKAFILDRAVDAALAVPGMAGVLLNIGGDIVVRGAAREIQVSDPFAPFDNTAALSRLTVRDAAVATSGTSARGGHLIDPRSGRPATSVASATAIAADAVTANALATTACIAGPEAGLGLVERTRNAEAMIVDASGRVWRSSGFGMFEQAAVQQAPAGGAWPEGFQLSLTLTLLQTTGRGAVHRPYVGVWAEDMSSKLVRVLAFWANEPRYYGELSILFNRAGRKPDRLHALARATRLPGRYDLVWDGLDDQRAPVAPGQYKIIVETNQEGGSYAKQSGVIACGREPAEVMLPGSINAEPVAVRYGPTPRPA